jgi:hypothetical protein
MSRGQDPREPLHRPEFIETRELTTPFSDPESRSPEEKPARDSNSETQIQPRHPSRSVRPREIQEIRGRTYRVRDSEVKAMVELGKFRTIAQEDLIEFFYAGDKGRFRADMENLVRQGLVELKSVPHEEKGSRTLLTLAKQGHRFLTQTQAAAQNQILYHGFAIPREAHHDADLYRLYQKAAEEIERNGGRNLRVVLDFEMKKRVYHDLAQLGRDRDSAWHKREVAERYSLQIVRGKIPVPDIRIEYETRDGEKARIDLELATGHYRGRNLAEKIAAGFAIFARAHDAAKLRKVLDQRRLTAEILPL